MLQNHFPSGWVCLSLACRPEARERNITHVSTLCRLASFVQIDVGKEMGHLAVGPDRLLAHSPQSQMQMMNSSGSASASVTGLSSPQLMDQSNEDLQPMLLPKKNRGKAATKQKPLLKKALSSYNFFYQDYRAKLTQQMPNTPGTELTRLIGKAWEAISEQDRKHYDEKARVAAEEYKVKVQQLQQAERATLTKAGLNFSFSGA